MLYKAFISYSHKSRFQVGLRVAFRLAQLREALVSPPGDADLPVTRPTSRPIWDSGSRSSRCIEQSEFLILMASPASASPGGSVGSWLTGSSIATSERSSSSSPRGASPGTIRPPTSIGTDRPRSPRSCTANSIKSHSTSIFPGSQPPSRFPPAIPGSATKSQTSPPRSTAGLRTRYTARTSASIVSPWGLPGRHSRGSPSWPSPPRASASPPTCDRSRSRIRIRA